MTDITSILKAGEQGDPRAAGRLLAMVYGELRQMAAGMLVGERPEMTLNATALVHEAYLRLADTNGGLSFENRRHFFASAAQSMRRILVEDARQKGAMKRGPARIRVTLDDDLAIDRGTDENVLALDEALSRLSLEDSVAGQVVELRCFAGLGHEEIALALNLTVYQARQKWTYARAWLRVALQG